MAGDGRSAGVGVWVRPKPVPLDEKSELLSLDARECTMEVRNPRRTVALGGGGSAGGGGVDNTAEAFRFRVNGILSPSDQEAVYTAAVRDLVEAACNGISTALLAYGQTGAGKTHTMMGPAGGGYHSRGMTPRSLEHVFAMAEAARRVVGRDTYRLRVSYMEIYNDRLIDLLAPAPGPVDESAWPLATPGRGGGAPPSSFHGSGARGGVPWSREEGGGRAPSLHVAEDGRGRVTVRGLSCPLVATLSDAMDMLAMGQANRAIAEHALNKGSTRSHCIFTVYIEQPMAIDGKTGKLTPLPAYLQSQHPTPRPAGGAGRGIGATSGGVVGGEEGEEEGEEEEDMAHALHPGLEHVKTVMVASKLHLVDLAGSERLEKSESVASMAKEATAINKSLSFLEQVVVALTDKGRSHVPYRSCKLTHVLKEAFTHGRTRLIAAIWPAATHVDETLSTMRFAMRMLLMKTTPTREVQGSALSEAERERLIRVYEQEIAVLRSELALHDALVGRTGVAFTPLSEEEVAALRPMVARYVAGEIEMLEVGTVRQFHACAALLRDMVTAASPSPSTSNGVPPPFSPTTSVFHPPASPTASSTVTAWAARIPTSHTDSGRTTPHMPGTPPHGHAVPAITAAADSGADSSASARVGTASTRNSGDGGSKPSTAAAVGVSIEAGAHAPSVEAPSTSAGASTARGSGPPPATTPALHDEQARNAELAAWRSPTGPGGAAYAEYVEAKMAVKRKREALAALAQAMATKRAGIEDAMAQVQAGVTGAVSVLAELKTAYRALMDDSVDGKAEVDYLHNVAAGLAQAIAADFQAHWAAVCAGTVPPIAPCR